MRPAVDPTLTHSLPATFAPTRILLIEDDARIGDVVSRALEAEGYHVDIAAGGKDGLQAAIRQPYDLVIRVRPTHLTAGGLSLDLIDRQVQTASGAVQLAQREFRLLLELLAAAGETLSKDHLLEAVWGYHFDPGSNVVDVYIRRLRAKIGNGIIKTIRGEGYRIDSV